MQQLHLVDVAKSVVYVGYSRTLWSFYLLLSAIVLLAQLHAHTLNCSALQQQQQQQHALQSSQQPAPDHLHSKKYFFTW
jgi:hypothetical protein